MAQRPVILTGFHFSKIALAALAYGPTLLLWVLILSVVVYLAWALPKRLARN